MVSRTSVISFNSDWLKFQFNYLANKLSRLDPHNPKYSYVIPEERTFITQFGGQGFNLEPDQPNHWINFTVKTNKITAFYKKVLNNEEVIYYKRDFTKADIISFEFTKEDQVEKINGHWKTKQF